MRAVIQRVIDARVEVDGAAENLAQKIVSLINDGPMTLIIDLYY